MLGAGEPQSYQNDSLSNHIFRSANQQEPLPRRFFEGNEELLDRFWPGAEIGLD